MTRELSYAPTDATGQVPANRLDNVLSRMTGGPPMGEVYTVANATATTITTIDTWTRCRLAGSTLGHNSDFSMPANFQLQYDSTVDGGAHIGATLSIKSAGANNVVAAKIVKNATVNGSEELTGGTTLNAPIRLKLGAISDVSSTAIHCMTTLTQNDTLDLFIKNESGTSDLTVTDANMFAMVPRMFV